jgi:hypothetical protein
MRFLDRLIDGFRTPDPTGEWPPGGRRTLTLDLGAGTLDGIGCGAPWEELQRFGRPANTWAQEGGFDYPALGTHFYVQDDRVSVVSLVLRAHDPFGYPVLLAEHRDFAPAAVRLVHPDGGTLEPTAATTAEEAVHRLGPPATLDDQPEYVTLAWPLPGWSLELEFGNDGGLYEILLTNRTGDPDLEEGEDEEE